MADLNRADEIFNSLYSEETEDDKKEEQNPADEIFNRLYSEEKTKVTGNTFYNPEIPKESVERDYGFDDETSLKKSDLKQGRFADDIRTYMLERFGDQYRFGGDKDNNLVVEDFMDHMRAFNTNTVNTAGEARFVYKANDRTKQIAKNAYELYDNTGNVFVNDGLMGAVDGVKDYIFSAASDPTNYLGLITGGTAKATALGVTAASKQAIKLSVAKATKEALEKGLSKKAADKIGKEAGQKAFDISVKSGFSKQTAKRHMTAAAKRERGLYRRKAFLEAEKASKEGLKDAASKKSVYATGGLDASFAALQDAQIQSLMIDVGAQEQYSLTQTAFSSLLGSVGAGAQIIAGKGKGKSGLDQLGITGEIDRLRAERMPKEMPNIKKAEAKKIAEDIKKNVKSWRDKVEDGRTKFGSQATDTSVFHDIILGADGKGLNSGLVHQLSKQGIKIPKNRTVSDLLSNVVPMLPSKELAEINDMLKMTGVTLGDATGSRQNLGDLVAYEASRGGQVLNVMSQASKVLNATLLHGEDILTDETQSILAKEADKVKKSRPFSYGQNLWRRMLVSSPATTAINVAGFTQYFTMSTLADTLNGGAHMIAGTVVPGQRGKELRRRGQIYMKVQQQKMRNLLDPYTTHDAYMEFLENNDDISKVLFETYTGGVERTGKRYNVDTESGFGMVAETVAEGAAKITGVRIQDSFTKSQMFMGELDKYLRLKHDKSLWDVIKSGDTALIDDDVQGAALDGTLRSVFAKDYTKDKYLLSEVAKGVEKVSNIPIIGTVIPFGRFMNNVVATSYDLSVGGYIGLMKSIVKNDGTITTSAEAASRSIVALGGAGLAMQYDDQRRADGLGVYEIDIGGGQIADMKNTFPFSIFLVAGRILNLRKNNETIPPELSQELGRQLAVGQTAKDAEFGNDLNAFTNWVTNIEGAEYILNGMGSGFSKTMGNFASGFTRPLDAVNQMAGYISGTDTAKDVKQASGVGMFVQTSTKYVDNIVEAFKDAVDGDEVNGRIEGLTGEDLAVGIREGKIYNPNPFAKVLGLVIKQKRTSAEELYSVAEMQPWTVSQRSEIPAYDAAFNKVLAPLLEREASLMLADSTFTKADLNGKRTMIRSRLKGIRNDVSKYLDSSADGNTTLAVLQRKAASAPGNSDVKTAAGKFMKKEGMTSNPKKMNYYELHKYLDYIEYYKKVFD